MKPLNISETKLLYSIITGADLNDTKRIDKAIESLTRKGFIRKNFFNILELNLCADYRKQRGYEPNDPTITPEALEALKNKDIEAFLKSVEFCNINVNNKGIDFMDWTTGGVNMIHNFQAKDGDYFKQFVALADDFDIDEEIDVHREGESYCKVFTHKSSVDDFTQYHNRLKFIANVIRTKRL